jgi:hypothetical protein
MSRAAKFDHLSNEQNHFTQLWKVVVDGPPIVIFLIVDWFFAQSSSLERKFRGFQLFSSFVVGLPWLMVENLFGQNFIRSLINHAASGDRFLHKAAKKSV